MSFVCPLINYTLATEENVRNVRAAHDAITFQLLEMSSIKNCFIMKKIWKLRVNGIVSVTGTHLNVYQIL